jgi:hypothetical protein
MLLLDENGIMGIAVLEQRAGTGGGRGCGLRGRIEALWLSRALSLAAGNQSSSQVLQLIHVARDSPAPWLPARTFLVAHRSLLCI